MTFALPPGNKYGDFAEAPGMPWTVQQRTAWQSHQTIPTKLSDIDASYQLLTLLYIVPTTRRWPDNDVRITKAIFERLEKTPTVTAIVFRAVAQFVVLLPRVAIGFSEEMRKAYGDGSINDGNAPTFGDCLRPGFGVEDGSVNAEGNLVLPGSGEMTLVRAGDVVQSMGAM